jgi:DNA-binding NtrC family response regulator
MMELIQDIRVATQDSTVDVKRLSNQLLELGLRTNIVSWPEAFNDFDIPIVICATLADIDEIEPFYDDEPLTQHNFVVWDPIHPARGHYYKPDITAGCLYETFDLPLDECIYGLVQSHIQTNRSIGRLPLPFRQSNMIGNSPAFTRMISLARRIAKIDCDVLIQGETGTGKELIARSIHYQSDRQDHPFVPINCGAFSDELLLSELFGHTKGAFTGAGSDRVGLIEQAENGTLFLDEIDSLSGKAQVALLRYLQDREVRPQGSNNVKACNTRVLAASNKPLQALVLEEKFREDLLFRLDVLHIDLPPLRERGDDIHLLVQYFINKAVEEYHHSPKIFSPNMIHRMAEYEWPGNIRQLQNIIYRVFLLSDQFVIRTDLAAKLAGVDWKKYSSGDRAQKTSTGMRREKQRMIESFETSYLKSVLSETAGNISQAARIAKKERRSFIRLMKKYNIERKDFTAA